MIRVILGAVALVGAFIALLVWISSPADDRLKTQNELIDGNVDGLGKRTDGGRRIPTDRPRKAAHVLMEIAFPKGDPRGARGGPILASLRGNGVTYRRASVNDVSLERHRVAVKDVDAVLSLATRSTETTTAGGFRITVDLGKGRKTHTVPEQDAVRLLDLMKGHSTSWTPPALNLRCAVEADASVDGVPPWPTIPSLEPPHAYDRVRTFRAPSAGMKRLLGALKDGDRFVFEQAVYRVVAWEPVNQS